MKGNRDSSCKCSCSPPPSFLPSLAACLPPFSRRFSPLFAARLYIQTMLRKTGPISTHCLQIEEYHTVAGLLLQRFQSACYISELLFTSRIILLLRRLQGPIHSAAVRGMGATNKHAGLIDLAKKLLTKSYGQPVPVLGGLQLLRLKVGTLRGFHLRSPNKVGHCVDTVLGAEQRGTPALEGSFARRHKSCCWGNHRFQTLTSKIPLTCLSSLAHEGSSAYQATLQTDHNT